MRQAARCRDNNEGPRLGMDGMRGASCTTVLLELSPCASSVLPDTQSCRSHFSPWISHDRCHKNGQPRWVSSCHQPGVPLSKCPEGRVGGWGQPELHPFVSHRPSLLPSGSNCAERALVCSGCDPRSQGCLLAGGQSGWEIFFHNR